MVPYHDVISALLLVLLEILVESETKREERAGGCESRESAATERVGAGRTRDAALRSLLASTCFPLDGDDGIELDRHVRHYGHCRSSGKPCMLQCRAHK